jgi:indolepyruvate ferredoxin oxidoreductase
LTFPRNARVDQDVKEALEIANGTAGGYVFGDRFTREVAISLYKLMSYKGGYEVARLYTETDFLLKVQSQFEGTFRLRFHLAPPLLSKKDDKGHPIKKSYGSWVLSAFRLLAKAKVLRGTALDPFGYTEERRAERAAIRDFENLVHVLGLVLPPLDVPILGDALQVRRQ